MDPVITCTTEPAFQKNKLFCILCFIPSLLLNNTAHSKNCPRITENPAIRAPSFHVTHEKTDLQRHEVKLPKCCSFPPSFMTGPSFATPVFQLLSWQSSPEAPSQRTGVESLSSCSFDSCCAILVKGQFPSRLQHGRENFLFSPPNTPQKCGPYLQWY